MKNIYKAAGEKEEEDGYDEVKEEEKKVDLREN